MFFVRLVVLTRRLRFKRSYTAKDCLMLHIHYISNCLGLLFFVCMYFWLLNRGYMGIMNIYFRRYPWLLLETSKAQWRSWRRRQQSQSGELILYNSYCWFFVFIGLKTNIMTMRNLMRSESSVFTPRIYNNTDQCQLVVFDLNSQYNS